jgi:hypothetical protein
MTRGHRHARGVDPGHAARAPRIVLNDPALSASQPAAELAASAANALGHAIEGPLTPRASPVPVLAAREAARLLAHEDDRDALALGRAPGGLRHRLHGLRPAPRARPGRWRASPACGTAPPTRRCCPTRPSPCAGARRRRWPP